MANNGSITNGTLALNKTTAGKYRRLRYFHGMLLTERDFLEEQTYFRQKLKQSNRLHGSGVVWGLEIQERPMTDEEKENNTPVSEIIIKSGLALDCDGEEVYVCRDKVVDLADKITFLERQKEIKDICSPPGDAVKLYIGISYSECQAEPVQQYTSTCEDDPLRPEFSRVQEGYSVQILSEDELPECSCGPARKCQCGNHGNGQKCQEFSACCSDNHVVILGCVDIGAATGEDRDRIYDINAGKIWMGSERKMILAHLPTARWEDSKLSLYQKLGWKDISLVIGMEKEAARQKLYDMYDNQVIVKVVPWSTLVPADLGEQVKHAGQFVPPNRTISLITETTIGGRECVIFAMEDVSSSPRGG